MPGKQLKMQCLNGKATRVSVSHPEKLKKTMLNSPWIMGMKYCLNKVF